MPGASNYDDSYGYGGFQSQSQSQALGERRADTANPREGIQPVAVRLRLAAGLLAVAGRLWGIASRRARRTCTTRWAFAFGALVHWPRRRVSGGGAPRRFALCLATAPRLGWRARDPPPPRGVVARRTTNGNPG